MSLNFLTKTMVVPPRPNNVGSRHVVYGSKVPCARLRRGRGAVLVDELVSSVVRLS